MAASNVHRAQRVARRRAHAKNDFKEPCEEGVTFTDLELRHCRWPLPSGRYCGEERLSITRPYCAEHEARAHQ